MAAVATQHASDTDYALNTGLMAVVNVTMVNYTAVAGGGGQQQQQAYAFEPCGRCQAFRGGSTTQVSGLRFVQPGLPSLVAWSWGHQVGGLCKGAC